PREHRLILKRGAGASAPGDPALGEQLREEVESLLEQQLVRLEWESEKWERLGERAATHDYLRATVRHRIECCKALEHAHRIIGAEHRDRAAELDLLGTRRDRSQHDLGCGDREVAAMMLADTEECDSDLVGQHRLLDHVADHLVVGERLAIGTKGDIAEGVESEFYWLFQVRLPGARRAAGCRWLSASTGDVTTQQSTRTAGSR